MKKVSVVVPAYCPGEGINRVVRSIEKQTLPQDEFELIIVDDGSPDDTWERLQAIRDSHDNVRIERIENSGWPSRPRNVGIDMAEGEYVLFMDHDDALFEDGLRASYDFAKANDADVLSPKESKTSDVGWGIGNYSGNIDNARPTRGVGALFPMMPHKFYRTAFLRDHRIRFPEGRRMLWEDVYFNISAYKHAQVISILSETPVYLWVETEQNNSATYGPRDEEFWQKLRLLYDFIDRELPAEEFAAARGSMMRHQYNTRIVGRFWRELAQPGEDWIDMALGHLHALQERYLPPEVDAQMPPLTRPRAHLLRHGRIDLARRLRAEENGLAGRSRTSEVSWDGEALTIHTTARWSTADDKPLVLLRRGDRLVRSVPDDVAAVVPEAYLDVTDEIRKARSLLTVRDRKQKVTWELPTDSEIVVEPLNSEDAGGNAARADAVTVTVRATATVDLRSGAGGRPLAGPLWDFHAKNVLLGTSLHKSVLTRTPPQVALLRGRSAVAYTNKSGHLSLDLAQKVRSVVADATAQVDGARFVPAGRGGLYRFDLPLAGVRTAGRTALVGSISLSPAGSLPARVALSGRLHTVPKVGPVLHRALGAKPARLVGDADGARIEGLVRALPGTYHVAFRFQGRTVVSPLLLRVPLRAAGRTPRFELADSPGTTTDGER
ncbi:glycosyltransferase family 2 protein [Georgenia deserti]|uniref:Glycosyltransferase family 2 protein n=1 Tax=Georgenia deserti TaxID=2093781 RepID=A0ABW4L1W0_9MICO